MSEIAMMLAFPLNVPPSLSRVSSVQVLIRHMQLAIDNGLLPVAAEYLEEIRRRDAEYNERNAA